MIRELLVVTGIGAVTIFSSAFQAGTQESPVSECRLGVRQDMIEEDKLFCKGLNISKKIIFARRICSQDVERSFLHFIIWIPLVMGQTPTKTMPGLRGSVPLVDSEGGGFP